MDTKTSPKVEKETEVEKKEVKGLEIEPKRGQSKDKSVELDIDRFTR